jgi:hypothetical protein
MWMKRVELAEKLGITVVSVRYMDENGLLPFAAREREKGMMVYYPRDAAQAYIDTKPCFRNSRPREKKAEKIASTITFKQLFAGQFYPKSLQRLYSIRRSRARISNPTTKKVSFKRGF